MTKQLVLEMRFVQLLHAKRPFWTCTAFFLWGNLWDEAEVREIAVLPGRSYTSAVALLSRPALNHSILEVRPRGELQEASDGSACMAYYEQLVGSTH